VSSDVVELVQQLIRNRCVNEGTRESGGEVANADLLESYLDGVGLDMQRFQSAPGRDNLVARIEGSDPKAPTLCLLGHTDVVPVNEDGWERDPFGGELLDGFVWGRGAIDMFNLTASMAVAMKALASSGFRPRGTLIYGAVADEEALGTYGAEHLITHEADAVRCDYLITEAGGMPLQTPAGLRLPALAGEKGPMWSRLRVTGTPGHASMPYGANNALVRAAEVVRRLDQYRPAARIDEGWKTFVSGLGLPDDLAGALTSVDGLEGALTMLPPGIAKLAHACTHTTIIPTVMRAGSKTNVIPDCVDIELDIRTLAGVGPDEIRAMLAEALGDLDEQIEVHVGRPDLATSSPTDTPLWEAMGRAGAHFYESAQLLAMPMAGATDARHFRRGLGTVAYGFGLFSERLTLEELAAMGHGDNERVDVESLELVTSLWDVLVRDFLG